MKRWSKKRRPRSGAVLVAALVCLLIAMGLVSSMLASTLTQRLQLRIERDARQTALLVTAGRDRALARLAAASDYDGETWSPMVIGDPQPTSGEVIVRIDPSDPPEDTRRSDMIVLRVTATYPVGSERPIRRSQTFSVPRPPSVPEGDSP